MLEKLWADKLKSYYIDQLYNNIVPFWLMHAKDMKFGGYITCLERDGTPYEKTKVCMWGHGRIVWTFSHLYNEIEARDDWLEMARWGIDFILKHAFASDNSMYYSLSRKGRPLEVSRDVYTELSTCLGFHEYARATNNEQMANKAWKIMRRVWDSFQRPGQSHQPLLAKEAPVRMFGHSMITLNVLQEFRKFYNHHEIPKMIDQCINSMLTFHLKQEQKAVFELVSWDGSNAPGHWGRWVNPGHMIEGGTFLIHEGQFRNNESLIQNGLNLIDWGFNLGWDEEYGGIFNDVDIESKPFPDSMAYLATNKLWWQHAEALYAHLLAYSVSGKEKYIQNYNKVHGYVTQKFQDNQYNEWFSILDRRGFPVNTSKGTSRKNIFHIGRNFSWCYQLLKQLAINNTS